MLVKGKQVDTIVGPDVHSVNLARELVKRRFLTSLVVCTGGETIPKQVDGIEIIAAYRRNSRVVHGPLRALAILVSMLRAHARVYIHSGVPLVSIYARMLRKKCILEIVSDAWVLQEIADSSNREFYRTRRSFRQFLHYLNVIFADKVLVQSEWQRVRLLRNYNKSGEVNKIGIRVKDYDHGEEGKSSFVLWVGNFSRVKGPEEYMSLARILKKVEFKMIGGHAPQNRALYMKLKKESESIPNLEFIGPLLPGLTIDYFRKAALLVNTSTFEGFPHTFVEAWASGTPVVTLNADPDCVVCKRRLGIHSRTMDQLVADVEGLMNDDETRIEMGLRAKAYASENYQIDSMMDSYLKHILELL